MRQYLQGFRVLLLRQLFYERKRTMSKLYWTRDIKEILDNKIADAMNKLLDINTSYNDQDIVNAIRDNRRLRVFCDEVIAEMKEMDRHEDEDRKGATV